MFSRLVASRNRVGRRESPAARSAPAQTEVSALPRREPLELYGEFFRLMNGRELTENELCLLREAGEEALL